MQAPNHALKMGRMLQKKQTGFIHYCHQSEDRKTHDTIPVYENALFALALLRSRLADHVLEGKALLEKLLAFEQEGNFPVYLHDFPRQDDPFLGLRLYPVFFWICHDFSHVIGELKNSLPACMQRIKKRMEGVELPPWAEFRYKALRGEVGSLPKTVFDWGEGLITLQLAEKMGADIDAAIGEATALWHPALSLYVGPIQQRHQDGLYPEVNLFDLFMCAWQKHYPLRAGVLFPVHLKGALIRPREVAFEEKPIPFVANDPFFLAWHEHTLIAGVKAEESIDFYLNYHPDHEIFVEGKKATTFQERQELQICSKDLTVGIQFEAEKGTFFGRILRGNRPAQHACKGEDHFTSYDWRFSIQMVRSPKDPSEGGTRSFVVSITLSTHCSVPSLGQSKAVATRHVLTFAP